jgi:hypothetical protein
MSLSPDWKGIKRITPQAADMVFNEGRRPIPGCESKNTAVVNRSSCKLIQFFVLGLPGIKLEDFISRELRLNGLTYLETRTSGL